MKIFWRIAPWLSRLILVCPTFIFVLIASKYLIHPAQTAAEVGISLTAPLGATILRVGFGAFPLGCAIFIFACLISERRFLTGLSFVATMVGVVLLVRIYGMLVDGTVKESMSLIRPEVILLVVCFIGLTIEFSRRRRRLQRGIARRNRTAVGLLNTDKSGAEPRTAQGTKRGREVNHE